MIISIVVSAGWLSLKVLGTYVSYQKSLIPEWDWVTSIYGRFIGFTSEAIAFAVDKRLWLVNGSELVHMVEDGRSFLNKPVIPEPEKVPAVEDRVCPSCQSKLVMRVAKRGVHSGKSFYGCSTYPKCRYTSDY